MLCGAARGDFLRRTTSMPRRRETCDFSHSDGPDLKNQTVRRRPRTSAARSGFGATLEGPRKPGRCCVVPEQPATSKKVLVVGGSLGAKILNDVVPQAMKQIKVQSIDVWHQTGGGNEQAVLASYQSYGVPEEKVKVTEFIDDMAAAYQWADVVICRAGALTVSELAMAAKPAIFIPLPHAVDDHQTKNAMYLVSCGAAKLIAQKEFNGTTLGQMLNSLFISDKVVQQMSKAAHNAAHADATKRVASVCIEVAQ